MTQPNHARNLTAPFDAICAVAKECFGIDLARAVKNQACHWGDNPLKPTVIAHGHELSLFWDTPENRTALNNEAIATKTAQPLLEPLGIAVPDDKGFMAVDGERLLRVRTHISGLTLAAWRTIHAPSPDAYDAKIAPQLGKLIGHLHANADASALLISSTTIDTLKRLTPEALDQNVKQLQAVGVAPAVFAEFHKCAARHFQPRTVSRLKSPFVFCHGALNPTTLLVNEQGNMTGIKDWHTAARRDFMGELAKLEPFSLDGTAKFLSAYTEETAKVLPAVAPQALLQAQLFASAARLAHGTADANAAQEHFASLLHNFETAAKRNKPKKKATPAPRI